LIVTSGVVGTSEGSTEVEIRPGDVVWGMSRPGTRDADDCDDPLLRIQEALDGKVSNDGKGQRRTYLAPS